MFKLNFRLMYLVISGITLLIGYTLFMINITKIILFENIKDFWEESILILLSFYNYLIIPSAMLICLCLLLNGLIKK